MSNANIPNQPSETITNNINTATKLSRTFMPQMEALKRYRKKADQKITVEHVSIGDGGKAIIGDINNTIMWGGENKNFEGEQVGVL